MLSIMYMKLLDKNKNNTPVKFMVVAIICVFIAEAFIMIVLSVLPEMNTPLEVGIDSTFIVIFTLPVLYNFLFLPLQNSLKEKTLSETKYRLIFETALYLITSVDSNGILVDCNNKIVEMLGYRRDEIIGQSMTKILHLDSQEEAFCTLKFLVSTDQTFSKEYKMVRKDGVIIDVNISSSSIRDKNGEFLRSICIIDDISETLRLQKLESRADRLEMAGTIAGQVAHDFNNLLAPILAYPEFIRDELPENHNAQKYLISIEDAAKKIAVINQDLLTMGRRGHYNQDIINLNQIVIHTIKEMEFQSKTISYQSCLDKNIRSIKGGSAQIHRMLINLLINAKDAMDNNGVITIKTENYYADNTSIAFGRVPKGEYIKLTISDTGCGIQDDIIQKILDPFFSTKTTDKKRGSGLGLSVVDSVIKDHNGYLDLHSKIGRGTSFFIYFPITREGIEENSLEKITGGIEKILIVDDDEMLREVSTKLLNKLGYEVNSVESGESAVKFLINNRQDLIILDMVMPFGIDGTETYKRILEINPTQKAIIVSGFSESDRVVEAQKMGVGAFVRKPFTKSVIASAIRVELDRNTKLETIL